MTCRGVTFHSLEPNVSKISAPHTVQIERSIDCSSLHTEHAQVRGSDASTAATGVSASTASSSRSLVEPSVA